jgi:hypothetical protein
MKDLITKINESKGLLLSLELRNTDEMYEIFNAIHLNYHNLKGENTYYKKDNEHAWEALLKAAKQANIELDPDYDKPLKNVRIGG